ncbi:MAG: ABC transporter permease [Acidimicrobiia bacterium]|nr:ABC transporter permease [Acidimicrobiia bacterium]
MPGGVSRLAVQGPARLVERSVVLYRRLWYVFAAGMAEPVLYLLAVGLGVGELVGELPGPDGEPIDYSAFIAPGLLAAAAMFGAIFDATLNFFVRYKYMGIYEAMLATPLRPRDLAIGETCWSLLRGAAYATAFLVTMVAFGLVGSWWAALAVPAAVLVGYAFAGAGLAASTWMRSWLDFDFINMAILPLFLFSGTFFPLTEYPEGVRWLVQISPLYQGVALERALVLGEVDWTDAGHALYLAVLGTVGLRVASRRLGRLLQP